MKPAGIVAAKPIAASIAAWVGRAALMLPRSRSMRHSQFCMQEPKEHSARLDIPPCTAQQMDAEGISEVSAPKLS